MNDPLTALPAIVAIGHWLIVILLILRVVTQRHPIGVSLAWIAVIATVPFVGAVLYLLLGEHRLARRLHRRLKVNLPAFAEQRSRLRAGSCAVDALDDERAEPLRRQIESLVGLPATRGNRIDLLAGYEAVFDSMLTDVEAAAATIDLAFYIWAEGGRADDVVDALVRATARGVRCRVAVDALGSKPFLGGTQIGKLRAAGIAVVAVLPVRPLQGRADLRNHRKIVVVDGRIGYTGSQNLVDPRFFKQDAGVGEWVDAMARVAGPIVSSLAVQFAIDWSLATDGGVEPPDADCDEPSGGHAAIAQLLPTGPLLVPEAAHQVLLTAIYAARRELVLSTPYFVPDEAVLTALLGAANRGVDVTLIVPERNDSLLVRHASASSYDDVLSAGARLALYRGGLLHTKSITIDGSISMFGSVNLDMRSIWLNFEISLLIYDCGFTEQLRALQQTYVEDADLLTLDVWRKRSRRQKLLEDAIRLLGPIL